MRPKRFPAVADIPVRRRLIRAYIDGDIRGDEPWMLALQGELDTDSGMNRDARYKVLFAALSEKYARRQLSKMATAPEDMVGERYPLYVTEVASLMNAMGIETGAKTIERMVEAGQVPTPPTIGAGRFVRSGFFARHTLDALFALTFFQRPVVTDAWLTVLRGDLPWATATYLRRLPRLRPEALPLLTKAGTR